ncbi:MAG: Omp28-related outer membrane protein [Bacteroidales bacterium]|nr:Omp28-related outer membrane protein [Bacteroidales bacterium]
MKIFRYILAAVCAAAAFLSCSGTVDDSSLPVLTASDAEIDLATETQTVFTVTYNGVDVTSQSEIFTSAGARIEGNTYSPEAEGSETFYAVYSAMESNTVSVTVINTDVKVESKYKRHVFVAEFTGASCSWCPKGYDNMMGQLSKPWASDLKSRIHIAAFHSEEMGTDTLAIPATMHVKDLFGGLDLPSYAVDLRDAGGLTSDGVAEFGTSVKASFNEYTPHCGVAVSSALASDGKTAEIKVKVASELTAEYRVVVLVLQDGIVGYQKHGDYGELNDYIHKHVVRQVVTSYVGTFTGEKLTSDGRISAGQEAEKTWTVDVDGRWVLANTKIYALALDSNGYVNNMNVCAIEGGDSGYDIK